MTEPIDPKEIVNVEPETGDIIIRLKRGYPLTPEGFEKLYADHLALCDTSVSYTHLRAHETVLDLVCRLLLEKKKSSIISIYPN